ncbi:MAG: PD-(D/E)XK nuclease family protein [Clostridia bacterium]|nr:PD-(D/E)XK nuclease family protein [Clostridia bacterium]
MKIDFILSDTTKGATTQALKKVVLNAESDLLKNHIVIVPETKSIIIEKELLSLSKKGAFANVFVYSFVRLLDRLEAVSFDKIMSKQTLIILIRKIISENIDKLLCYKKTAKTVGFAEKIYDTIAQFKSSGITVEELKSSLSTKKESLKAKLKDIIFLYEEYENQINGKMYDDCDKLALISNFSKENEFIKSSDIYIVGFDNITFEMQTVLRDLAINSNSITFSSVYFNKNKLNAHIQNNELFLKFRRIADSLKYPYFPKFYESRKQGDFKIIKNHLFSTEKRKFKSFNNVKVFKAQSEKIEIDFVANTILSEINSGKRFKDIGVMVSGLGDRLEMIKDCFNVYKIPYFANVDQKIDNHFLVKFITNVFELFLNNLRSENVLTFVSNPIFGAENYDIFDRYVYETGVNYDDFLNDVKERFIENYLGKSIEKIDENLVSLKQKPEDELTIEEELFIFKKNEIDTLKKTLLNFKNFYENIKKKLHFSKTANDYLDVIEYVIKTFDIEKKLESLSEIQRKNGLEIESEITKAIFVKLETFNKQIKNFLGETEMPLSEFILVYKSGFSSYKINLSPVSIDCVIIQENTDGFYGIKDLFIVGAVEGQFPTKIQDSGIILDSELEEAKSYIGKTIEPAVKDINRREKYKAFESLLEPTEKLYISYSERKQEGKINNPAQIVTSLIEMFGSEIVYEKYVSLDFINYDAFENRFSNKINDYLNGKIGIKEVNKCRNILGDKISKELQKCIDDSIEEKSFIIDDVSDLYFDNDKTSISQIQTYFECPYSFFATYGLRLKENKIATISTPDVGTIIHRVAELFLKNFNKYKDLNENDLKDSVIELVCFAMEENDFLVSRNKSLFSLILDECIRLCNYIIKEQSVSSFKFDMAEYNFDGENAVNLELENDRKIKIHGKIDRIDKFGDYVRVIDYKTGNISSDLKSIYFGTKIQLAVYLSAISVSEKLKPAGIFYFPIHSEYQKNEKDSANHYKMQGFILDDIDVVKYMDSELSEDYTSSHYVPLWVKFDKKTGEISYHGRAKRYAEEQFNSINDYVKKLCSTAVDEILKGYMEPSPVADNKNDTPKSCKYCELAGFCSLEKARYKYGRNNDLKVEISSFEKKENSDNGE